MNPGIDEARTNLTTVPGPKDQSTADAPGLAQRPEVAKRYQTLAALYALAGHGLIRSQPGEGTAPNYAARRGLIRPLDSLDEAEALLRRTGGSA
jgi:hypothetical protein